MKKTLLPLFVLAALALAYYFYFKTPRFSGPHAEFHEHLRQYSEENDFGAKYALAMQIALGPLTTKLHALTEQILQPHSDKNEPADSLATAPPLDLSEAEKKILENAESFLADTNKRVTEFERSLNPADIEFITAANPKSLYRKMGTLRPRGECGPGEIESLKATMSAPELRSRAPAIMMLATSYEYEFQDAYAAQKAELLRRDERFQDFRELAALYADPGLKKALSAFGEVDIPSRIQSAEEDLAKTGIERAKVREYVTEMAAQHPACLGRANTALIRHLTAQTVATTASPDAGAEPQPAIREIQLSASFSAGALLSDGRLTKIGNVGCRLTSLVEGGAFGKLGLREGDVITQTIPTSSANAPDCLAILAALEKKALRRLVAQDSAGKKFEIRYSYGGP